METPSAGSVVLVPFPFSDLSESKLRPAVVLAEISRDDLVCCQVTSNPYADPNAVELTDEDFAEGSLKRVSYTVPESFLRRTCSCLKGWRVCPKTIHGRRLSTGSSSCSGPDVGERTARNSR